VRQRHTEKIWARKYKFTLTIEDSVFAKPYESELNLGKFSATCYSPNKTIGIPITVPYTLGQVNVAASTQPSTHPGYVNRVPACMARVKAGCVHLFRMVGNTV